MAIAEVHNRTARPAGAHPAPRAPRRWLAFPGGARICRSPDHVRKQRDGCKIRVVDHARARVRGHGAGLRFDQAEDGARGLGEGLPRGKGRGG